MNIVRLGPKAISKYISGGGDNFQPDPAWMTASYGSGWPIQPVMPPRDTTMPRVIDYPMSVNATLTPRTGYGLMPFAALLEAYENVTEVRTPVNLIWRELTSFIPRLVDNEGNEVQDHDYAWMTKMPDRETPFSVWMTRFLKSAKVYDAPAIYFNKSNSGAIDALHYIDGSTLFLIVDQFGRIPKAEKLEEYVARVKSEPTSTLPSNLFGSLIEGTPTNLTEYVQKLIKYQSMTGKLPEKVPAYTQIIKGTPFAWWSADQVWYMPQSRRMNSPYGESFIEQAWPWIMLIVNLVSFELGHYRTGTMPEGFVTLPAGMFPQIDRINAFELAYNQRMTANPATERMRLRMFPDGSKWIPTKKPDFPALLYDQAWKNILHTIGIPPSEFGDIPGQGLGGAGFKEGAATDLSRNTLNPHRKFVAGLFNEVLERNGVDDVYFDLGYPLEEIDPEKQRQQMYEGMAHGTLSLNDAAGTLGLNPIGNVDDPNNIANKHMIVAGSTIYVIEDMQLTETGMAVPNFQPTQPGMPGGLPVGPESVVAQDGQEHTPEDFQTIISAIKNLLNNGTLDGKTYSIPESEKGTVDRVRDAISAQMDQMRGVEPSQESGGDDTRAVDSIAGHIQSAMGKVDQTHSDGGTVAVFIPGDVAAGLRGITEGLGLPADARLETPDQMHVTLAFLTDAEAAMGKIVALRAAVSTVAAQYAPLQCQVQGFGMFNGKDGMKVLFALLDCVDLPFIRTQVCQRLDEVGIEYGRDYGFVPHITLAYVPSDWELPAGFAIPDIECQINELAIAFGPDVTRLAFSLGMDKVALPSGLDKHCGVCPEDSEYFGAPISREIPIEWPQRNHVNEVEIVAMVPDGLPPKVALWKPEGGEMSDLRSGIDKEYPREEAAYLIDRSLGFYLVPLAYVQETDDGEIGAVIYYSHGMGDGYPDVTQYDPAWVERAAVLDYIISQSDRGPSHNYGTHPDEPGRPILFDNGLCLANAAPRFNSPFCDAMLEKTLSDDTITAIKVCLNDKAMWRDVSSLVGTVATKKAMVCAQRLIDERAITSYESEVP